MVLASYMMRKYQWGLRKTMEFLSSRRPDITLKPAFLQQLSQYERRLNTSNHSTVTTDWQEILRPGESLLESDELLLRNTYINSHIDASHSGAGGAGSLSGGNLNSTSNSSTLGSSHNGTKRSLTWSDSGIDDKNRLEKHPSGDKVHCTTAPNGVKLTKSLLRVTGSGPGQQLLPRMIGPGTSDSSILIHTETVNIIPAKNTTSQDSLTNNFQNQNPAAIVNTAPFGSAAMSAQPLNVALSNTSNPGAGAGTSFINSFGMVVDQNSGNSGSSNGISLGGSNNNLNLVNGLGNGISAVNALGQSNLVGNSNLTLPTNSNNHLHLEPVQTLNVTNTTTLAPIEASSHLTILNNQTPPVPNSRVGVKLDPMSSRPVSTTVSGAASSSGEETDLGGGGGANLNLVGQNGGSMNNISNLNQLQAPSNNLSIGFGGNLNLNTNTVTPLNQNSSNLGGGNSNNNLGQINSSNNSMTTGGGNSNNLTNLNSNQNNISGFGSGFNSYNTLNLQGLPGASNSSTGSTILSANQITKTNNTNNFSLSNHSHSTTIGLNSSSHQISSTSHNTSTNSILEANSHASMGAHGHGSTRSRPGRSDSRDDIIVDSNDNAIGNGNFVQKSIRHGSLGPQPSNSDNSSRNIFLPIRSNSVRSRMVDASHANNGGPASHNVTANRRREASPKVDHGSDHHHSMRTSSSSDFLNKRGESPIRVARLAAQENHLSNHHHSGNARLQGSPHRGPSHGIGGNQFSTTNHHPVSSTYGAGYGAATRFGTAVQGPGSSTHAHLGGSNVLGSRGSRPGSSGMNAFRNSGPVKAHHRVCATRPSTAPTNRAHNHLSGAGSIHGVGGGPGSGHSHSRPNSPLLQRQNSGGGGGSRPGSPSPLGRPASPSRMPSIGVGAFRTKSLSSHMRRAPSPTPAFNRAPSPNKPRWRM